ncbi:GNAT family N-acetyltransferase, partial [Streptomyces albidoflavus]|uniref:GNAT family N-acetyltransferase n=1 Tax=Streptomyces albidoflavus TaxID=1886 RepID=UPI00211C5819
STYGSSTLFGDEGKAGLGYYGLGAPLTAHELVLSGTLCAACAALAACCPGRPRRHASRLPPTPPPLPAGVTARPMTEGEYAQWETVSREAYAQEWANRGLPEEQARARSEASYRDNLPQGLATPGVSFGVVEADGAPAGHVWVSSGQAGPGVPGAYVFDIEVRPEFRGRGLGRALMLLAERAAFDTGDSLIGLHVFADNTPARRLYDSLGYTPTRLHWSKPL